MAVMSAMFTLGAAAFTSSVAALGKRSRHFILTTCTADCHWCRRASNPGSVVRSSSASAEHSNHTPTSDNTPCRSSAGRSVVVPLSLISMKWGGWCAGLADPDSRENTQYIRCWHDFDITTAWWSGAPNITRNYLVPPRSPRVSSATIRSVVIIDVPGEVHQAPPPNIGVHDVQYLKSNFIQDKPATLTLRQ